jgi:hypothetical protein
VRALGKVEEKEEKKEISPEGVVFDYLKDSYSAVTMLCHNLLGDLEKAVTKADADESLKADVLTSIGSLWEGFRVAEGDIWNIKKYVDHDLNDFYDILVHVAKYLLLAYGYLKAGNFAEARAKIDDATIDLSMYISEAVRHAVEKAGDFQEAQDATEGSNA